MLVGCRVGQQRPGEVTATAVSNVTDPSPAESSIIEPIASTVFEPGEWVRVEPGGKTRCAHDTPYAFWARPGNPEKVVVYFQGGGGCWDARTCAPGSSLYDASVSDADDPSSVGGILDLTDARNPFKDNTMLYVPSCTGDVHWGDIVREYGREDGSTETIYHRGFINGQAALEWLYANVTRPENILVTGCSAGSVGSIVHAPFIIEHYPEAEVSQLGDSLAFVFHRPVNVQVGYNSRANFPPWIGELETLPTDQLVMSDFYAAVAGYYPQHRFSQFNSRADRVQQYYYSAIGGDAEEFSADLSASLEAIRQQSDNFYSYLADGTMHCVTPRPEFYSMTTAGVQFLAWLEKLSGGELIDDVTCAACE